MKNDRDKDNSLLPLCRQDTKKEKEQEAKKLHHYSSSSLASSSSSTTTRAGPIPKKQPTQQESAMHKGRAQVGRQGHQGTQGVAHPADGG
jgi:hypothetical protein